jgi:hypothetical protein
VWVIVRATSDITIDLIDACIDGYNIDYKYYDTINNVVWPSATTHWVTSGYNLISSHTLKCQNDGNVCIGGRSDSNWWGMDVDGSKSGTNCCVPCESKTVTWRLTCDVGEFCGGIAAIPCPSGKTCIDDPRDNCDPLNGGSDCGGVCIATPPTEWCSNGYCGVGEDYNNCPQDCPAEQCGGFAGLQCPEGKVCYYPGPSCQVYDCTGFCVPIIY